MSEEVCRWSSLRRLSPRAVGGARLPDWRRADLTFTLTDGAIVGVVARRRLWLWSSLADAVTAALTAPQAPARLGPPAVAPPPDDPAPRLPGRPRAAAAKVIRLPER